LIEGLHDLQRHDLQSIDKFICSEDAFNKLVESMVGSHPDFITLCSAALELTIVVEDEIIKRYSDKVMQLELKKEKAQSVWENIKPNIEERMKEEFGSIFSDSKDFISFVECGETFLSNNFSDLQAKVSKKATDISYQALCKSPSTLHKPKNKYNQVDQSAAVSNSENNQKQMK
jgi:hypothetical protein